MSSMKKWFLAGSALAAIIACMKAGDGVGLDSSGKVIPFCTAYPDDPACQIDPCVANPASKACSTSVCEKDSTQPWCHQQPDCAANPTAPGCSTNICDTNPDDPSCPQKTKFSEVYSIFQSNGCVSCHSGTGLGATTGKLNMGTADLAYANLVGVLVTSQSMAPGWKRVVPSLPDSSVIYFKVSAPSPSPVRLPGGRSYLNRMPLDLPPISNADIELIKKWIQDGAVK